MSPMSRSASFAAALALAFEIFLASPGAALATPALLVDLDSGSVLEAQEANRNWYPASITKLMTTYVALSAVREGRISMDTPMIVSKRAARMAPSKMGFKPGSQVTLANALKILMVKSANDVAVTVAEGVGGSVEGFAEMMNAASRKLGMSESNWVNPNGLPDARQVTSARDMALLATALHREFPEEEGLWHIGAIEYAGRVTANHNGLIGRYPGADGMKTGFTCAAGFNVVATATRGGRRLLAVVLGQPSASIRTAFTAQLFDRGFSGGSSIGSLSSMSGGGVAGAPDMRSVACTRRAKGGTYLSEIEDLSQPIPAYAATIVANNPQLEFLFTQGAPQARASASTLSAQRAAAVPVHIYLGPAPGWSGATVGPTGVAARSSKTKGKLAVAPTSDESAGAPLRLSGAQDADAPKAARHKAGAKAGKAAARARGKMGPKAVGKPAGKGAKSAHKPAPKRARAAAK